MRGAAKATVFRAGIFKPKKPSAYIVPHHALPTVSRGLANVRDDDGALSGVWFSATPPAPSPSTIRQDPQPDERTLKLGKTIRILHERLPDLLASPLPQDILSPQITLHLFPSTHTHLPAVSGRIAYTAALWTAPVAWGRFPIVGNVKLIILSERMVKNGVEGPPPTQAANSCAGAGNERLVVRWKTCGKTKGQGVGARYRGVSGSESERNAVDKITQFLGGAEADDEKEFCGLFMFEFDGEGRIVRHVIEHAQEGGNWEKKPNIVSVTDWLLGRAWGKKEDEGVPGMALGYVRTWEGWGGRRADERGKR